MLDEVCRINDLQSSCRIVGQNLENLKDAKQTGFRPTANFVQRQGLAGRWGIGRTTDAQ